MKKVPMSGNSEGNPKIIYHSLIVRRKRRKIKMIESKDGIVKVKGKLFEIKADLSAIINSLRKNLSKNMRQDEADKHIRDAVDKGFMTEDEIVKKIEELAKQIPDELKELVNVMLSVGGDADEVK